MAFIGSGLILTMVAVDTLGLPKMLCDKKDSANQECISQTRFTLYVSLAVAFVVLVPLQVFFVMLFENMAS